MNFPKYAGELPPTAAIDGSTVPPESGMAGTVALEEGKPLVEEREAAPSFGSKMGMGWGDSTYSGELCV